MIPVFFVVVRRMLGDKLDEPSKEFMERQRDADAAHRPDRLIGSALKRKGPGAIRGLFLAAFEFMPTKVWHLPGHGLARLAANLGGLVRVTSQRNKRDHHAHCHDYQCSHCIGTKKK